MLPESVNVLPASGTNFQSYPVDRSVSVRMPNVSRFRTWLFGCADPSPVKNAPPVPTTNCRMPRALSRPPVAFCGANLS